LIKQNRYKSVCITKQGKCIKKTVANGYVQVKLTGKKGPVFFIHSSTPINYNIDKVKMDVTKRSNKKYLNVNMNEDTIPDWSINNGFRFVDKNGHINIEYSSIGHVKNMHSNVILFIMQAEWWLVLTFVLFGFLFSWFFFAFLYFLVSIEHGDFVFNEEEQMDNQTNYTRPIFKAEQEKCVQDVHNFLSALLFSIETQHTIGYGSRYITTECIGGILVLTLQSSLGYLLQVIVTQIVFTKLSRPTGEKKVYHFHDIFDFF
jgi:hypothetical protein